jgi:hypothetical protein
MFGRDAHQPQQPVFDLNTLDTHHEIRMKYDRHGNLVRITKVRRNEGCVPVLAILILLALLVSYVVFT